MGVVYISILPPILDLVSWVGSQKKHGHELEVNKDKLTPVRKTEDTRSIATHIDLTPPPASDDMVDLLEKLVPVRILLHTPG